jgi:hypothetical protein
MFEQCAELKRGDKIVVEHEKSKCKALFHNKSNKKFRLIKIDGCVIKSEKGNNPIRADWMLEEQEDFRSVIIEIKGSDIKHAYNQIVATKKFVEKAGYRNKLSSIIVCNKVPSFTTEDQDYSLKMRKEHKMKLKIKSKKLEIPNFDELFSKKQ